MKAIIFATLLAIVAAKPDPEPQIVSAPVAHPAGTFFTRAPRYDSAVIKSDRLGGNFAYSVAEAHAYEAHTPIVQQVHTPVAVSYNTAPAAVAAPVAAYTAAAPAATYYASAPAANYYNPYYNPYAAYSGYGYYGR